MDGRHADLLRSLEKAFSLESCSEQSSALWYPPFEVADNLLVRIHFIIVMIRWTGLAAREFEFPFPGSLTSTFLEALSTALQGCQVSLGAVARDTRHTAGYEGILGFRVSGVRI